MANGSSHEGPARADRLREQFSRNQRMRQTALATQSENRDLPSYRESDSEITANTSGLHAKGIPRFAWWMIGAGIALFLACVGIAIVRLAN